ncbi:hypothetical protein [Haladaptatus sp. DFWS20]|uniref:hypothetical protein n=1 Tax=Haladaptatus sp. DFWS20 TaxID=3403467 RepID=UPI003EBEC3C2
MERYETRIDDGVLFVDSPDGWLKVGTLDDIVALMGGETYTISYETEHAQHAEWLNLDETGEFSIPIRKTVVTMDHPRAVVSSLACKDLSLTDRGYPERTTFFADFLMGAWNVSDPSEGIGRDGSL